MYLDRHSLYELKINQLKPYIEIRHHSLYVAELVTESCFKLPTHLRA